MLAARIAENGRSRYAFEDHSFSSLSTLTACFQPSQCDEAVPACSQCINTKRHCPGYVARFDLVLRDQTKAVRRKAQRKKEGNQRTITPPQSASSEDSAVTKLPLVGPAEGHPYAIIKRSSSDSETVPRMFNDFPQQQAICAFFLDFVLLPHHPDSVRGHLEHLVPLYKNTHSDSPLTLATSSVALAISGGSPIRRNDAQLGRTFFGRALHRTSAAIRDPLESKKDETLMAVLLLGLYEVCLLHLIVHTSSKSLRSQPSPHTISCRSEKIALILTRCPPLASSG